MCGTRGSNPPKPHYYHLFIHSINSPDNYFIYQILFINFYLFIYFIFIYLFIYLFYFIFIFIYLFILFYLFIYLFIRGVLMTYPIEL